MQIGLFREDTQRKNMEPKTGKDIPEFDWILVTYLQPSKLSYIQKEKAESHMVLVDQ